MGSYKTNENSSSAEKYHGYQTVVITSNVEYKPVITDIIYRIKRFFSTLRDCSNPDF